MIKIGASNVLLCFMFLYMVVCCRKKLKLNYGYEIFTLVNIRRRGLADNRTPLQQHYLSHNNVNFLQELI